MLPRSPSSLIAWALLALALLACTERPSPTPASTPVPSAPAPTATPPGAGTTVRERPAPSVEPSGAEAYRHVLALSQEIGSRVVGTEGGQRAASYLADRWRALGYEVELQPFLAPVFEDNSSLAVTSPQQRDIPASALFGSPRGTVTAPIVHIGLGRPQDIPAAGLRGNIALIERGDIFFRDKVANAAAAGAVGAIIYNNRPGPAFGWNLQGPAAIPALGISQDDGQALLRDLQRGPVTVRLQADAGTRDVPAQNVIARPAPGATCRYLVGGHYDSVAAGPGANDNASGVAVALEVSRVLRELADDLSLCFAAFDGEEEGLHGSQYYVAVLSAEAHRALRAMVNLDMVGVGTAWHAIGSPELVNLMTDVARAAEVLVTPSDLPPGTGSDHASFIERGIPAVFLHRVEDPNWHTAEDRAVYVDPQALEEATRLVVAFLLRLDATH